MKTVRLLSLVLLICMLFTLLAACTTDTDKTSENDPNAASTTDNNSAPNNKEETAFDQNGKALPKKMHGTYKAYANPAMGFTQTIIFVIDGVNITVTDITTNQGEEYNVSYKGTIAYTSDESKINDFYIEWETEGPYNGYRFFEYDEETDTINTRHSNYDYSLKKQ